MGCFACALEEWAAAVVYARSSVYTAIVTTTRGLECIYGCSNERGRDLPRSCSFVPSGFLMSFSLKKKQAITRHSLYVVLERLLVNLFELVPPSSSCFNNWRTPGTRNPGYEVEKEMKERFVTHLTTVTSPFDKEFRSLSSDNFSGLN